MATTVMRADRLGGSVETILFAKSITEARGRALALSIRDPHAYYAAADSDGVLEAKHPVVTLHFFHDGHELDSKEEAALMRRNPARVR